MKGSRLVGVCAAFGATIAWSLNFIVPFVKGPYSIFDFALLQFLVPAVLSFGFLLFKKHIVCRLDFGDWIMAFALGLIGYLSYSLALVGAALYAGPVIAPAFLGLVPVVLAVIGNLRERTVSWRALSVPLTLALLGLLLVNGSSFDPSSSTREQSFARGIPLCILAVLLWVSFGLLNQSALAKRPHMHAGVWTALILAGAGLGMLAFYPFGSMLGVFEIPHLGLRSESASAFLLWGATLGVVVNVGGALAWTLASQRLPVALSAQLITMEPTFGTVFGLLMRRRWPTLAEAAGMTMVLTGVVVAIRIFNRPRSIERSPAHPPMRREGECHSHEG